MDKPSVEQQVCGDMTITFVVRKTGAILLALVGLTAGWLAVRQNMDELQIF